VECECVRHWSNHPFDPLGLAASVTIPTSKSGCSRMLAVNTQLPVVGNPRATGSQSTRSRSSASLCAAISAMGWARGLTRRSILQNVPRAAGYVSSAELAVAVCIGYSCSDDQRCGQSLPVRVVTCTAAEEDPKGASPKRSLSEAKGKRSQGTTTPRRHPSAYTWDGKPSNA